MGSVHTRAVLIDGMGVSDVETRFSRNASGLESGRFSLLAACLEIHASF